MSEHDEQERTEQPSEKRLREAREKGDVPRSRDLSGAVVVLAGVSTLLGGGEGALVHVRRLYTMGMSYGREALLSDQLPSRVLNMAVHEALALFAPVAAATMLAALAAPVLLGGLNFSAEALQPKLERLDPIKGLGKIFAMRGLVELGKSLLKLLLIGAVLLMVLKNWQGDLMGTGQGEVGAGMVRAMSLLGHGALLFGSVLALIGGADALYQKFDHNKRLRMTRQELKDESKESDGNPELKGRIRQLQFQMARKRMMQELPTADVLVTNPSHFAVAFRATRHCQGHGRAGAADPPGRLQSSHPHGGSAAAGACAVCHHPARSRDSLVTLRGRGAGARLRVSAQAGGVARRGAAEGAATRSRSGPDGSL